MHANLKYQIFLNPLLAEDRWGEKNDRIVYNLEQN